MVWVARALPLVPGGQPAPRRARVEIIVFYLWSVSGSHALRIRGGFCVLSSTAVLHGAETEREAEGNGGHENHLQRSSSAPGTRRAPSWELCKHFSTKCAAADRITLFDQLPDVNGNNYYIRLLVGFFFFPFFFPVSDRPLIYLISIVLGSWPFLEYLLVILIFYIYIYVCVNIYIYIY